MVQFEQIMVELCHGKKQFSRKIPTQNIRDSVSSLIRLNAALQKTPLNRTLFFRAFLVAKLLSLLS